MIEANRRTVLLGAGAAGVSAVVAACGGGEEPESGSAPPANASTPGTTATESPAGGGAALAKVSDVPVGGGMVLADQKVVLTQPAAGEIKAFSAVCTHRGCTVANVSDGTINCSCHGSRFDATDGAVRNGPATRPLEPVAVTVEGDEIVRG